MPRLYEMSWDGPRSRWVKMYRGKRYTVACSVLSAPATQEGSRQAANAWWAKKKAEIDSAGKPTAPAPFYVGPERWAWPYAPSILDEFELRIGELGLPKEVEENALRTFARTVVQDFFQQHVLEDNPLPEHLAKLLSPGDAGKLEEAVKGFRGEPAAAPDKTVKAHAEAWLARQQALAAAGQMTAARAANNRTCLAHLLAFLGPDSDVAGIDADRWDRFYLWLLSPERLSERGKVWSTAYRKDVFSVARAFVRWLWEKNVIELPRNIDQKFKAGPAAKTVKTWTKEDFRAAVREAPGKLKLALLLMANTGMTQQDIADLRKDEVDWTGGRITRRRSKTKGHDNVPTVSYKLWPSTFLLLGKHRDKGDGDLVLLTEGGEPYVRTKLRADGRLSKADGFASHFVHLRARLKKQGVELGPLKELRKLGATHLGGNPDYHRFREYFLGHSPRSQAERHYDAKSVEFKKQFDEAVMWLGRELGQVGSDAPAC